MKAIMTLNRFKLLAPLGIGAALILIVVTQIVSGSVAAAATGNAQDDVAGARAATARFHDVEVAKASKYTLFPDAAGIECIDNPGVGAMGVHYVNLPLVNSGTIDALKSQALVYEPGTDGQLHLVAVEYIVFKQAWDATHGAPPTLCGQDFMLTPDGNRFGIPAFYSLHAWIWKVNPSGMFAMWNPQVSCAANATA